jgi:Lon protease-like protein
MAANPFTPTFAELPATLPIFPLPGVLLLPHTQLPLNIFEPRYLNMTLDALAADRMIGMIQPRSREPGPGEEDLYRTGCAGRITAFNETDDGRFLIVLTGVCRFDRAQELSEVRGYRRIRPDWTRFPGDLREPSASGGANAELRARTEAFLAAMGVEADLEAIADLPFSLFVSYLCMNLPLAAEEKQALLEATTVTERYQILDGLCEMGTDTPPPSRDLAH